MAPWIDTKLDLWHLATDRSMAVRLLLTIAASQSWPLYQMDVKNAFLHGDLKEEVYMRIPQGVTSPSKKSVCHLRRPLYGLKHAPRAWFETFSDCLSTIGFTQNPYNPSLFLSHASTSFTVLLVYVDDIIITGTDTAMIKSSKPLSEIHSV